MLNISKKEKEKKINITFWICAEKKGLNAAKSDNFDMIKFDLGWPQEPLWERNCDKNLNY